jgi:hypothetical protein
MDSFELVKVRGDGITITVVLDAPAVSGALMTCTVRREHGGTAVATRTLGDGITLDGTRLIATVVLAPEATAELPDRTVRLVADVQYREGAGEPPVTVALGHLVIVPDVTAP